MMPVTCVLQNVTPYSYLQCNVICKNSRIQGILNHFKQELEKPCKSRRSCSFYYF